MSDSDPRPMPAEVLRAYRDPVDLLALLQSHVYSDKDRMDVRDALLRSLFARYGDVWVESGSKEVRVSTRVKSFRKNAIKGIELLIDVPDYGGREGTLPVLAHAMQPMWALWWAAEDWQTRQDVEQWSDVSRFVLGQRQFAWIAAQYARRVIYLALSRNRRECLESIDAAEGWARAPSEENLKLARAASFAAFSATVIEDDPVGSASSDASVACYSADPAVIASAACTSAASALVYESFSNAAVASGTYAFVYSRLCALTKRLITPTLVTRAAR